MVFQRVFLFIWLLLYSMAQASPCKEQMHLESLSKTQADSFLDDAVYLENLVSRFSGLEGTDNDYFSRLNQDLLEPDHLQLIREALGTFKFDAWVEKVSQSPHATPEFLKLASTILGRTVQGPSIEERTKFTVIFAAPAQKFVSERQKDPMSRLSKDFANALEKLRSNPRHRNLNTHVHRNNINKAFISYINKDGAGHRMIWAYGPDPDTIIILRIIFHDDYDQRATNL